MCHKTYRNTIPAQERRGHTHSYYYSPRVHGGYLSENRNLHTRYLYSPRGNENRSGEIVTFFLQMPYHLG